MHINFIDIIRLNIKLCNKCRIQLIMKNTNNNNKVIRREVNCAEKLVDHLIIGTMSTSVYHCYCKQLFLRHFFRSLVITNSCGRSKIIIS